MGNANRLYIPYTDFDGSSAEATLPVHQVSSDYLCEVLADQLFSADPDRSTWFTRKGKFAAQMRTAIRRERRLVRRIVVQLKRRGEWA